MLLVFITGISGFIASNISRTNDLFMIYSIIF
jgi:hypothetical protein